MVIIDDITVRTVQMPGSIKSFVRDDGFGHYTIVINENLCNIARMEAYKHELGHIFNKDFDSLKDLDEIEHFAHRVV